MAPDLADHAYGHCLAVLLDAGLAEQAARRALGGGGRTTAVVLAHARHAALAAAPAAPDSLPGWTYQALATAELTQVARALTGARPAVERAIVDLHGRHGLDRSRWARTLGLEPATAAAELAAVTEAWAGALDPALLAYLGSGDCDGLAELIPDRETMTVDRLLAAAPDVAGHVETCEPCRDRMRAMVSVQDLVTNMALERAPDGVRASPPASGRWRRPAALPPPISTAGGRRSRRGLVTAGRVVGMVAVVTAAAGAAATIAHLVDPDASNAAVRALTRLPASNALAVDRAAILVPGGTFRLVNLSGRPLRWQGASPVPWLRVEPSNGLLLPHGHTVLTARLTGAAPGGQAAATIAITADDGSATALQAATASQGPADVAASVQGCTVTANAEAPSGIAAVALHWVPVGKRPATAKAVGDEHVIDMAKGDTGYTAGLPPQPVPIEWWVMAADTTGNEVDTALQVLSPGSCL